MACLDKCLPVRRWLTFVTGLVECLCFAGIVFGWASLVFVLKMEGYFSSLYCGEQDEQFSLIFTMASVLLNLLTFSSGLVFDWFGTTVAKLCRIHPSRKKKQMKPFLLKVGNLFGARRSTVITLYNGAFDSSAALFLVIKLLHEVHVSFHISFHFLSACSVIHLLRTLFLMPQNFIPYPLSEHCTYGFPLHQFGKLFSLAMALAGLFALLQYPFILVEDILNGDPLYVNIALTLLILFPFIHPISVYVHCPNLASQRVNGNAIAAHFHLQSVN
ncbi:solute carrier family 43 member 3-like [Sphaeramia orbicularis]|uniref:solute carrier family 43 member 3-like n=1 Tax=Sphaeramia orbicularis TaxID=375764 RepID=UPI00118003CA|nr:solute carrier family 43 member 3-like [Sphaeramia orbicularis]